MKVYLAHKMSGRTGKELVNESRYARFVLNQFGIAVNDPVVEEGIEDNKQKVMANDIDLYRFWQRDKELIRQSDVLIDLTGPAKSEGTAHELGYARYCLWIPVVRVYPGLQAGVSKFEDDIVVSTLEEAALLVRNNWGTYRKRLLWRLRMLSRCFPSWLLRQIKRLGQ